MFSSDIYLHFEEGGPLAPSFPESGNWTHHLLLLSNTFDVVPMTPDSRPDRRTVLKASGTALLTGTLAGCTADGRDGAGDATTTTASGTAATDADGTTATDSEGTATTDSEETTTSDSGRASTVTVEVGPERNLVFEPSGDRPLVVAAGTTVEFVWRSNVHNVVVDRQPDDADWQGSPGGDDDVYDEGFSFSHTFDVPGIYDFHCVPHESAGMTGTIVVTPEGVTPEYATTDDLPVRVGPDGDLTFSPGTVRPLKVPAGTEVEFVWESDTHNVVVDDQPETADWNGTPGDSSKVYDAGYEYGHTFEVSGVYRFHCEPHESVGMVGIIVVEER